MSSASIITDFNFRALSLPLFEPFGISGGSQAKAENVLVQITLADGTTGLGEGAPLPAYNRETQKLVLQTLETVRDVITDRNVEEWQNLCFDLRKHTEKSGSAQCALEIAIMDAFTKQRQMPLWKLFGNGRHEPMICDMTITTNSDMNMSQAIEHAKSSAQSIIGRGIRTIKTKVGANFDIDIARLKAIKEIAPESPLILDGNGAFLADDALRFLEALEKQKIVPQIFEQPVKGVDIDGLRKVTTQGNCLVIADESVTSVQAAQRVIGEQAAHGVNLKIMKAGVLEAVEIARLCHKHNVKLMIGGNVETILAMTSSAHVSYGIGTIEFHDLDTPAWILENPFRGGFSMHGDIINLPTNIAGHGVML